MLFIINKIKRARQHRLLALAVFMLMSSALFAQEAAPASTAAPSASGESTILWYLLIATMGLLLFAVLILGNVLINLAKLSLEKAQKAKGALTVLLLLSVSAAFGQDAPKEAAASTPYIFNTNLIMAAVVLLAEIMAIVFLVLRINEFLNELSDKKEEAKPIAFHLPKIFDKLNASVAIEEEGKVMTDHEYDGIRELDNDLPPWWKYGFYVTIVWAVAYLFYYHVSGGPLSTDEYNSEVAAAKIEVEEYMKKNALNVDENSVKMGDASMIAEGAKLFGENCVACHGAKAEGNTIGPNLTDDYWIHGGSIQDVFKTIKYGWPAKGMRSWQESFSPVQIQQLASYVKSVHGSNPENAKEPQGELYQEGGAAPAAPAAAPADSTQNASM